MTVILWVNCVKSALSFRHTAANWFDCLIHWIGQIVQTFVIFFFIFVSFRVFSQHHISSGRRQSDTAVTRRSHILAVSSANHTPRSGPDQQQQQQEGHLHRWSSQTGRRLDEGDRRSSQSTSALPEPDQTAETPAGPGGQSTTYGSSDTGGSQNGDVQSGIDDSFFWGCT